MTALAWLLTGLFTAGSISILFRSLFTVSLYPSFQIPVIFIIVIAEIATGFYLYKYILPHYGKRKSAVFSFALSSLYIPVLTLLISEIHTILGLSYNAEISGFGWTIFPLIVFLPFALSAGFLLRYAISKKMNYPKIFTGAILFFAIDYILLWKYAILYPAFFTTLCGIIILGISSRETLPKISYYFTAVIILLFTLSSGPKIVTSSLKKLNPDNDKTILSYQYTPYGETALHNKKSQYEASLNHARLFKIPDTQRMQETAHMTLLQYPWAEKILVIGGNKILVEEILKYPDIKSLYWASVVPGYFDFIAEAEDNPDSYSQDIRLRKIKNTDPRDFIRNISANNIFDVAIISVPDPFNLLFNRYYSYDFFLELRSIMSDYSITSLDLAAGEKFSGEERKILAASVYNTLKEVFPNTLEMYGEKSQILASHNRNFTTSYPALSEFLNTLESMPGFVSPALIRYKLNSNRQVKQYIQNTLAPLNTDIRPASLKYSFTQFIFTLSITPKLFLRYINRATPLIIYSIFAVISLFLIIIFQHKPLEYKLQFHRFCIVLLFGIFIYIIAVSVHITTGKIYSRLSAILLFITTGILLGRAFFKKKNKRAYLSYLKGTTMFAGVFFILIPTIFETLINPISFIFMILISLAGGFLFGSSIFLVRNIYLDSYPDLAQQFTPEFTAAAASAIIAILVIPVTGIVDILPASGILALGALIILNIQ